MLLNESNNFNYDTLNQNILEQAILLKQTSEIRALLDLRCLKNITDVSVLGYVHTLSLYGCDNIKEIT